MSSNRMLMIAYYFPPIGGGGVQRALKMAKYMGHYGWDLSVLTVEPLAHVSLDPSLLKQLPDSVQIYRAREWQLPFQKRTKTKAAEQPTAPNFAPRLQQVKAGLKPVLKKIKENLFIPDDQLLWYRQAVLKGLSIVQAEDFQIIYSTSGPYTNHLVAKKLNEQTGIPWIADFRDPWTQNMHSTSIRWRKKVEERLEKQVFEQADAIVTVTDSFARLFQEKYGSMIRRLSVIPNGYDPADYKQIKAYKAYPQKWTLVYTGIFYQERNPRLLLQCIAELIAQNLVDPEHISIQFAGIFDYPGYDQNMECVKQLNLEQIVVVHGHLPHQEALSLLAGADQLVLIGDLAQDSGAYIPGKLYEYMAVKKPILALLVEGEAAQLIRRYQLGEVVHPQDKEALKRSILHHYRHWKAGHPSSVRSSLLTPFSREVQAKQLADLAHQLCQG